MEHNNLTITARYNTLFFDENANVSYIRNETFWTAIRNISKANPKVKIQIDLIVKQNPFVSCLYEDVRISCSSDEIQEKLNRVYKDYYFGVPLQFYPEFVGNKDILEGLLRNDRGNASSNE